MIPYSRPKRSDLDTLCQSKLLENHTSHSGTYLYSPYVAVPPPPPPGCVLIYMLLSYQISAWVFLIHMFLYVGFYCTENTILFVLFLSSSGCLQQISISIPSFEEPEDFAAATF